MNKEQRFKIISEGLKNGISETCDKYNISRTIFYRWLKRYKEIGIDGLKDVKKEFIPKNKTPKTVENALFDLVKTYPNYGPRALKYLLEELGYEISESAVFNILNRNNLTNKEKRVKFSKKTTNTITPPLPLITQLQSGECWVFWITSYGNYENVGNLYEYTLFDLKSRIACTRLYNEISFTNFEEILTAVAIPVSLTLNLKPKYVCFIKDDKTLKHNTNNINYIDKLINQTGLETNILTIDNNYNDYDELINLRKLYTEGCLSFLLPLINEDINYSEIKLLFQEYIRNYNIKFKMNFDGEIISPIDYHNRLTNTKLILPLWAYIDRDY